MPPREASPSRCAGAVPAWGQGQLLVSTRHAIHLREPGTEKQARQCPMWKGLRVTWPSEDCSLEVARGTDLPEWEAERPGLALMLQAPWGLACAAAGLPCVPNTDTRRLCRALDVEHLPPRGLSRKAAWPRLGAVAAAPLHRRRAFRMEQGLPFWKHGGSWVSVWTARL